jgi:hypothetical protein
VFHIRSVFHFHTSPLLLQHKIIYDCDVYIKGSYEARLQTEIYIYIYVTTYLKLCVYTVGNETVHYNGSCAFQSSVTRKLKFRYKIRQDVSFRRN